MGVLLSKQFKTRDQTASKVLPTEDIRVNQAYAPNPMSRSLWI